MPVSNPRFPHTCKITRKTNDDPMSSDGEAEVIYEGVCRGYLKNTTSAEGEVITTNRGLSLPIAKGGWSEDTVPQEGDEVEVGYGSYKEHGQIIDRMAANFHGTHLIWNHVKD